MTAPASPSSLTGFPTLVVDDVREEAVGVRSLRLRHPGGLPLAAWEPGAHVDVVLPSGLVRQYSLCGDPEDDDAYRIAVLLEPGGRGGSRELHETDLLGATLKVRGPRNHFALVDAPSYLFLAGGIGVTPILAMARCASRRGIPWRMAYGGRVRASMAFLDELLDLPGGELAVLPQDVHGLLPLDDLITGCHDGAAVYVCGPEVMVRAVEGVCEAHGRLGALHVERFSTSGAQAAANAADQVDRRGFEVELRASASVLWVPPDRSVLDVVREVRPDVLSSCEEGFCGACEVAVLEGTPEHHDTILSPQEQAKGDTMMICVGRARTPRLVLDL